MDTGKNSVKLWSLMSMHVILGKLTKISKINCFFKNTMKMAKKGGRPLKHKILNMNPNISIII